MNITTTSFESFREVTGIQNMIYPAPEALRRLHEQAVGKGSCNAGEFGCEVAIAIRQVFGGRWPSNQ